MRSWITIKLIKMALRTTQWNNTSDYLREALIAERLLDD